MKLEVVEGGATGEADESRALAPGAPRSPGTVPFELARHLRTGEPLIWWDSKNVIEWRPALVFVAFATLILVIVSFIAPEFWTQPIRTLWKPLAALFSPAALLLVRERANLRSILVTDGSVIDVAHDGSADRIAFKNILRVRRDLLWGGVRLDAERHKVRIPPVLVEPAGQAIRQQLQSRIHAMDEQPDDPTRWLG